MLPAAELALPASPAAVPAKTVQSKPSGRLLADQHTMALDKGLVPGELYMIGQELRMRDHVPIQKHNVISPRARDRSV